MLNAFACKMVYVKNLEVVQQSESAFYDCRVVRGLLLAVGRPDGRLCSQTKNESWVVLGLQQVSRFLVVQNLLVAKLFVLQLQVTALEIS